MIDDKKNFRTLNSTLILIQQLQAKYYGKVGVDIDTTLSKASINVRLGSGEHSANVIFSSDSEKDRQRKYQKLITLINTQL